MTIAHKRAALELHNLESRDREWVLDRLAPAEQARVKPLLAELEAMNIRFEMDGDAKSVDSTPGVVASVNAPPGPRATARSVLREAAAADIARVLSHEPGWMIDAVLAIEAWPWASAVRASFAYKAMARSDTAQQAVPPIAPALANALVAAIAQRLQDAPESRVNGMNGHHGALNGVGIWHRVWPKVRRWLP